MNLVRPKTDFGPVHELIMQSLATKALIEAVKLKLFDILTSGPVTAEAMAGLLNLDGERLTALLDVLEAAKLLSSEGDRFGLTPVAAEYMVSTSPYYQGFCLLQTAGFSSMAETGLESYLKGEVFSRDGIDAQWSEQEAMEGTAQEACAAGLLPVTEFIAGLPGFEDFRLMADIGGNHAAYTMGVLDKNDKMRGEVLDLPHVAEASNLRCARMGYGDRIEAKPFDFRTDELASQQYDLIFTSHFLYAVKDHLPEAVGKIAQGLKPGGWFVAHHFAGRKTGDARLASACLDLMTRMAGYLSHFVEREELEDALSANGLTDIRFQGVGAHSKGLIAAARKPAK